MERKELENCLNLILSPDNNIQILGENMIRSSQFYIDYKDKGYIFQRPLWKTSLTLSNLIFMHQYYNSSSYYTSKYKNAILKMYDEWRLKQ